MQSQVPFYEGVMILCHIYTKLPVCLRYVGQGDVVVPDAPQAGQDLCEGGHDKVLAVPATIFPSTSFSIEAFLGR